MQSSAAITDTIGSYLASTLLRYKSCLWVRQNSHHIQSVSNTSATHNHGARDKDSGKKDWYNIFTIFSICLLFILSIWSLTGYLLNDYLLLAYHLQEFQFIFINKWKVFVCLLFFNHSSSSVLNISLSLFKNVTPPIPFPVPRLLPWNSIPINLINKFEFVQVNI